MKNRRKTKDGSAIEFWQSATDLSLSLVLILLLIIGMLILYLFQLPEEYRIFLWGTEQNIQETGDWGEGDDGWTENGEGDSTRPTEDDNNGGGGGGGGQGEDDEFHERYPIPASGGEDWSKSAVYLTVIDGETRRAIREQNIIFELYEMSNREPYPDDPEAVVNGAIRYLYTYYPEKIEYRNYKTRQDGTFYLPEKVLQGGYYFKEITEPEGYDSADIVGFNVDDIYDWGDPFVVSVALFPSKNVILVRLIDADTGELMTGGEFRVVAGENITTIDGTVRYQNGVQADTITIGEEGIGSSIELYLGKYVVSQNVPLQFYTTADNVAQATVEKKDGREVPVYDFYCQKTAIRVLLVDDLSNRALSDCGFQLCLEDGSVVGTAQTDGAGLAVFTNLEKNTRYTVKQTSTREGYEMDTTPYTFYVDTTGRIEGSAKAVQTVTNFIPRAEIQLQDILLHSALRDQKVTLYNSRDELIGSWISTGAPQEIENLEVGSYYVRLGNRGSRYAFEVTDSRAITRVTLETWSVQSIVTVVLAVVLIPAGIYLGVLLIGKVSKKRKKEEAAES